MLFSMKKYHCIHDINVGGIALLIVIFSKSYAMPLSSSVNNEYGVLCSLLQLEPQLSMHNPIKLLCTVRYLQS